MEGVFGDYENDTSTIKSILYVSSTLLIFHIVMFLMMPSIWNLFNSCLICYCVCLLGQYSAFYYDDILPCLLYGISCYMRFASNFWSLLISYDLRKLTRRTICSTVAVHNQRKRFFLYSCICWLGAFILTAALFIIIDRVLIEIYRKPFGVELFCLMAVPKLKRNVYLFVDFLFTIINTIFNVPTLYYIYRIRLELVRCQRRNEELAVTIVSTLGDWKLYTKLLVGMGIIRSVQCTLVLTETITKIRLLRTFAKVMEVSEGSIIVLAFIPSEIRTIQRLKNRVKLSARSIQSINIITKEMNTESTRL